jgi:hypothetical protein
MKDSCCEDDFVLCKSIPIARMWELNYLGIPPKITLLLSTNIRAKRSLNSDVLFISARNELHIILA